MAKRKSKITEGKQNIIAGLLEEYDIESAEDIQDALKDLLCNISVVLRLKTGFYILNKRI